MRRKITIQVHDGTLLPTTKCDLFVAARLEEGGKDYVFQDALNGREPKEIANAIQKAVQALLDATCDAKLSARQTDWTKLPPIKIGQHIPLPPGLLSKNDSGEGSFFTLTKKMAVGFAKSTDQALISAIIAKAKAEGITDLYVLDDEFILAAIREKIEREGRENEESNRAGL